MRTLTPPPPPLAGTARRGPTTGTCCKARPLPRGRTTASTWRCAGARSERHMSLQPPSSRMAQPQLEVPPFSAQQGKLPPPCGAVQVNFYAHPTFDLTLVYPASGPEVARQTSRPSLCSVRVAASGILFLASREPELLPLSAAVCSAWILVPLLTPHVPHPLPHRATTCSWGGAPTPTPGSRRSWTTLPPSGATTEAEMP